MMSKLTLAAAEPIAPPMAAAAPPPGVGCLAASLVRNWSIGRDLKFAIAPAVLLRK